MDSEQAETVQVPLASLGNVSEGDTVQMTVVSVDTDNGVANLAPAEQSEPAPDGSATDKMAGEIENPAQPGS